MAVVKMMVTLTTIALMMMLTMLIEMDVQMSMILTANRRRIMSLTISMST